MLICLKILNTFYSQTYVFNYANFFLIDSTPKNILTINDYLTDLILKRVFFCYLFFRLKRETIFSFLTLSR